MRRVHIPQFHFVWIALWLVAGLAFGASAQSGTDLLDLRDRLVEHTGDEYLVARDEALALPQSAFDDLLFLLRLSPDYSLEHILALIVEARAKHPDEAARFDAAFKKMIENPDRTGRDRRPIYRIWRSRESNEVHPLIFEAHIKIGVPPMPMGLYGMANAPNPDNVPFILYLAKHHSPGALSRLVTATKENPEERQWLRPLAMKMYKEHREAGHALGVHGIVGMFHAFGTPEDLAILKELREFEEKLMPAQNIVIRDRKELGLEVHQIRTEYRQRETTIARAEREGAPPHVLVQQRQQLEDVEAALREAERQSNGNSLWRQLNEDIDRLEAQLARKVQEGENAQPDPPE